MTGLWEFVDNSKEKYNKLKEEYIDNIDWSIYKDRTGLTVKYGNDHSIECSGRAAFSGSILRHIDANKCLYSKMYNKIPERADKRNYGAYYFDPDTLVMSEFVLGNTKEIVFYLNEPCQKIQAGFFVTDKNTFGENGTYTNLDITDTLTESDGALRKILYYADHSVYDNMNRLVSSELYQNIFQPPYGMTASGEYYEYSGERLVHAVKYHEYNKNNYINSPSYLRADAPYIYCNPEIYYYDFEYGGGNIVCQKNRKRTPDETVSRQYELKNTELKKLLRHGINCFGI